MKLKQLAVLLTSILLITLLAACGNSDSPSEETDNNQEDTQTNQEKPEEEETTDNEDTASITSEEASETAEAFLTLVADEDFEGATALFDDTMASEVTAADLEEIWDQLTTDFGEFAGYDYVDEQEVDGYYSILYEGAFNNQPVVLNVSVNGNNEVGGFFIQ
ncbi:DUF3887 domain-containing protein [Oceanobacillus neutriphilus]|uniref:DUF3887 domain-containing protein n=1 Tax=Oceanobacillus neutriphilus TaxID=531815 RepID=A0ABQ2NMY3_9BACI|nr:DUF3887 domain-containing protein [Oceanobacillus neutriphilus]GGP07409.1 hypothetical protein GCM10011346_03280 [Oceanobacillus neutriphilus]